MTLSESMTDLTYRFYILLGGGIGFIVSVINSYTVDFLLTALLSATGALSAGLVNYGFWVLKKRKEKKNKES